MSEMIGAPLSQRGVSCSPGFPPRVGRSGQPHGEHPDWLIGTSPVNLDSHQTSRARDHIVTKPGSQLTSSSHSYVVQSILGEGTFGEVLKCIRKDTEKTVVVKTIKDDVPLKDAMEEVAIMHKLRSLAPLADSFLWLNHSFIDQGRLCLEFDLLDISLWDMMKKRHFMPMSLQTIRPILQQIATGLQYLKTFNIIHADVKSSNIMIVDRGERPIRVKIIDFGKAYDISNFMSGSGVQSLLYRSPEIMLGLPYTEAIDMWSLGCVAAHLFLGFYLFSGKDEYQIMKAIVQIVGQPPDHLLQSGLKTSRFFNTSSKQHWRLKTPEEFYIHPVLEAMKKELRVRSLDDLSNFNQSSPKTEEEDILGDLYDRWLFVDLMKWILQLDAATRLTPTQVLQHSFFVRRVTAVMYDFWTPGRQPPISRVQPEQKNTPWTETLRHYSPIPQIHQQTKPYISNRRRDDVRHRQPPISRAHAAQKNSQWIHPARKSSSNQYVRQQSIPYISNRSRDDVRRRQPPVGRAHPAPKNNQWMHSLRKYSPIQYDHQQTNPHSASRRHDEVRHSQPPMSRAHPAQGNFPRWTHPMRKGSITQHVRQQSKPYMSNRRHDKVRHGQPSISRDHPEQGDMSRWTHPVRKSGPTQYVHQQTNHYTSSRTHDEARHGQPPFSRTHPEEDNMSWWTPPGRRSSPTQYLQSNPYGSNRRHDINRTQAGLTSRPHWKT